MRDSSGNATGRNGLGRLVDAGGSFANLEHAPVTDSSRHATAAARVTVRLKMLTDPCFPSGWYTDR
jgi:hypothetical protein